MTSSAEATELMDVLNRVMTWTTTVRITLARKILESLDQAETPPAAPPTPKTRGFSAAGAQRLLKTDRPPSDDVECRAILEEELMKKYSP